ncbi:siderophore-interacting protein [Microbacterium sp. No. 7]|uniref:siderophore-interacting protein n=1 Tax=Microbacterium sp. No. 7 TaxID=1714373 RepID=UPI0006CFB84C|nr:siderophore-interacting protein [Microbacterium sp. No. 7]ALJ19779.1 siderophore-interacting protein [Microbacterium sp. No. 7]
MAPRAFTSHPLVVRRVTVRRIEEVTPRMRRIVVGGEALGDTVVDGHPHRAFAAPGFDDHVKLVFANDGDLEAALPLQLPHGIEWTSTDNRVTRDYTPRWIDADAGEIALDFVLHGDGPAASWAQAAAVGDALAFVGPKSSVRLPGDIDWIVLIADETGLPAVGRFLDERPVDAPAHVVLLVEDESGAQQLTLRDGDTVAWHVAAAGDAAAVEAAVRALPLPEEGSGYVWAAAESRALLPVRRYLQRERGLAKDRLNITGYWHVDVTQEGEAVVADDAPPPLQPPASPVPWLVTRAAVQLGMIDALADGAVARDALAARLGVGEGALAALLPVLVSSEIVAVDGDDLRLGRMGDELLDEHHREEFDGLEADAVLALAELAPAARAGVSPWRSAHGETLAEQARARGAHVDELVENAGRLAYLLDGLAAHEMWERVSSVLVAGPGAPAVVGALEDAGRSGIAIAVHEHGRVREALRDEVERPGGLSWGAAPADVAVLALALAHRTDAEAVALLGEVAACTRRALVIESSRPDALSADADAHGAVVYAMTGAPFRTSDALAALAADAGWRREQSIPLGWGVEVTVLVRDTVLVSD